MTIVLSVEGRNQPLPPARTDNWARASILWLRSDQVSLIQKVGRIALVAIAFLAVGYLAQYSAFTSLAFKAISLAVFSVVIFPVFVVELAHIRQQEIDDQHQTNLEQAFGGHAAWERLPRIDFEELPMSFRAQRSAAFTAIRNQMNAMNTSIAKVFCRNYSENYHSVAMKLRDQTEGVETVALLGRRGNGRLRTENPQFFEGKISPVPFQSMKNNRQDCLTLQEMIEGRHPRFRVV